MKQPSAGGRPLAYTPEEAAELLRVSPSLIRSLVRTGTLPRVAGLGRAVRIPSRALFEFVGEPVPDLAATLEIEPAEVPEPRPAAPDRALRSRSTVPTPPRPARRPPAPRPRPPAPEGQIRVGDQRLWLLGDSSQYRLVAWHIGTDRATCGREPEGRWKRSETRCPGATMCPACLRAVARMPGVEMGTIPIGTVCMVRETRRGDSVALIKTGWHLGNGRVTSCGKREGPWYLTERAPQKEICFVCGERRQWERERIKDSLEAMSAGTPRFTVLVDRGLDAAEVEILVRRVPGYFATRTASRQISAEDFADYARGLHGLFAGSQVLQGTSPYSWSMAPDITISEDPDVLGASEEHWGVMSRVTFVDWAAPHVERAEKVQALRARWEKESSTGKLRHPGR